MENIGPEGCEVFAKINPSHRLVVRRYANRIYYSTDLINPAQKELVYFERKLMLNETAETI